MIYTIKDAAPQYAVKEYQELLKELLRGNLEMTDKELIEIEIAYFQEQIKVKQKKLKELEQTKSPAEEAYKDWWGEYPSNTWQCDVARWEAFKMGYNAAQKDYKVGEHQEPLPEEEHKTLYDNGPFAPGTK